MASDTTPTAKKIAIIIGSTRAKRIGPAVAQLIKEILDAANLPDSTSTAPPPTLTILDLATFHLPVFDEAVIPGSVPAYGQFAHAHTLAWNAAIEEYDAYIIVSAEYNFGVPGALKNAIDYLYHVWMGKPVMVVTYGIMGGNSASDNLKRTLEGMHLRLVETRPALEFVGRDEKNHNMSPDLMSAMGGVLGEASLNAWKEVEAAGIVKGFEELKTLLAEEKA